MNALLVIMIMASVYYFFQYKFESMILQPKEVESDPYYQAIYGTGEYSLEAMKERDLAEEIWEQEQQELTENFELHVVETPEPQIDSVPLEISTDEEVDVFIEQLQSEFNENKAESSDSLSEEILKGSEQLKMVIKNNHLLVEEGDFLDISELETAVAYQDFPKSSISDDIEGPQQWFVTVIGKEGEYLHVSDGTKKWVHVGEQSNDIDINDTLMISVEVDNGKYRVNDLVLIQ